MPRTDLLYPKLSYLVVGFCFDAHNKLGRFAREKQYGDYIEGRLKLVNFRNKYLRPKRIIRTSPKMS